MLAAMGDTSFWPKDERRARKRKRFIGIGLLVALLVLTGALLDPSIVAPAGPLASRPQRISAEFTRCGRGRSMACVVDGDTIRLGDRRIRILGIDTPELTDARCAGERALAERAADRLLALVNQGGFDLIGHRFRDQDGHGRDLRLLRRGDVSLGQVLIDEGHAQRYYGTKVRWC